LWRVVPEVTVLHRRDTESVKAAERPTDEHYRRYLTLVRQGTARAWPQAWLAGRGPFKVLDPGFSAILARGAADLAWLAEALGEEPLAEECAHACDHLASALKRRADSDGLIRPLDLMDETVLDVSSAGSALALLTPGLERKQIEAARDLIIDGVLASDFGVRSLDRHHTGLEPRNYWRGPVWTNVTWLCAHALELHGEAAAASTLRERMLEAVEGGGMREYFLPDRGEGLGAKDFAWTAALTLRELAVAGSGAEAA
jgi:glycogen debranching enzyme